MSVEKEEGKERVSDAEHRRFRHTTSGSVYSQAPLFDKRCPIQSLAETHLLPMPQSCNSRKERYARPMLLNTRLPVSGLLLGYLP